MIYVGCTYVCMHAHFWLVMTNNTFALNVFLASFTSLFELRGKIVPDTKLYINIRQTLSSTQTLGIYVSFKQIPVLKQ